MIIEIPMKPFAAVRSNRNSWAPNVQAYHAKKKALQLLLSGHSEEIITSMIEDRYCITFVMPIANSWSAKKRKEHIGKPHKQSPDIDNLFKSFADSVFYEHPVHNDREVSTCYARKEWGEEGMIIFESLV